MSKKINLKIKKDEVREKRTHKKYLKTHYKETVDYALDCFIKKCY